jgi:hypothetical protein
MNTCTYIYTSRSAYCLFTRPDQERKQQSHYTHDIDRYKMTATIREHYNDRPVSAGLINDMLSYGWRITSRINSFFHRENNKH